MSEDREQKVKTIDIYKKIRKDIPKPTKPFRNRRKEIRREREDIKQELKKWINH